MVFIFADAPIFFLPIFMITAWIYHHIQKQESGKISLLYIFYAVVIWITISLLIQKIVHIDRPESVLEQSKNLILNHIPDASFPSDHATVSVAFLVGLFLAGYKKIFYYFLPFVIIMNISRIMAGVHWPFDIIIGSFVWGVSAWFSFMMLSKQKLVKKLNAFIIQLAGYFKI